MFTINQIENAHEKVKSGADFPNYIKEIKQFGVKSFETWTKDSHTDYYGEMDYKISSSAQYEELSVAHTSDKIKFQHYLKIHQQGETDYFTFCNHCAETGIKSWVVDLLEMTCTYYDFENNEILIELINIS